MILVPLFDLKSLGSFRRLRCRDFKSAALVPNFRSSYTTSVITFYETSESQWALVNYDSSAAFRFEVPGFISPLAVQGLQIGGTMDGLIGTGGAGRAGKSIKVEAAS